MSAPKLLIDNDILFSLSGSGLLNIALEALGCNRSSAFCFPHLAQRIKKKGLLADWPAECIDRILFDCNSLPHLTDGVDADFLEVLSPIIGIDEGEAVLYAYAACNPVVLVTSGDKKSMQALYKSPGAKVIRDAIAGRIICFEAVCLEMVKVSSASYIANAFAPLIPMHNSLKTYFGGNNSESVCCYPALSRRFTTQSRLWLSMGTTLRSG